MPRIAPATRPDDEDQEQGEELFVRLDCLPRERRTWLLPGRLLAHAVNLIEGEKGVGKSTLCAAVVGAVTAGRKLLGHRKSKPASVLWLSAEESYSLDIVPRLIAAGADVKRVHGLGTDKRGARSKIVLPHHIPLIRQRMIDTGASLLIVDPIASFVDASLSLTTDQQIHTALDPLTDLALAIRVTVLALRHWTKDTNAEAINRGQGGAAVGGIARSVVAIEWPDRSLPRRVLRVVACNEAPHTPPAEYAIIDVNGSPAIGPTKELRADQDDAGLAALDVGQRGELSDAKALLKKLLAVEYMTCPEVRAAAERAEISRGTLRRAKEELRIHSRQKRSAVPPCWEWGPPKGGWKDTPPLPV